MSDPRYPIGDLQMPAEITQAKREEAFVSIAGTPQRLRNAVKGLNNAQLDTPYRDGGWTVRQVIHHVVDSHMNAYVRVKLALTEETPTLKPYEEALWAELPDGKTGPVEPSLELLDLLHHRWDRVWHAMKPDDFSRKLIHPARGERPIDWLLFVYEWHGRHHTAHITELRKQKGW